MTYNQLIYFVSEQVDPNAYYWKFLANLVIRELNKQLNAFDLIEFICQNIADKNLSWREVFYIEMEKWDNPIKLVIDK